MLYKKIGKSDIDASVIALGTWVMGGWMWGGSNDDESIKAIHAAIDSGINLIDTAPIYGFGRSEEVVGKAIHGRRNSVVIATKCGLVWNSDEGEFYFHSSNSSVANSENKFKVHKFLGPKSIRNEIENSLRRLDTDYIDLYQTHWQESTTPIIETMGELQRLKEEGKIRAIGVSNASVDQIKKYGDIDSDQEKYSMLIRNIEKEGNTKYCDENEISLLAYSPLAQGLLTGKIKHDKKFGEGDLRNSSPNFTIENIIKVNKMLAEINSLTEKYDKNIGQIILGWTLQQRGITHLLCGTRTVEQVILNAESSDINLSKEELSFIDNVYGKYFLK